MNSGESLRMVSVATVVSGCSVEVPLVTGRHRPAPKTASAEVKCQGGTVRIAGMCKGSGMIHPGMATMLAYVFTDAKLGPAEVRAMLRPAAAESFGRISVDGDMSTNDTVYLLANGASGVRPVAPEKKKLRAAVRGVMIELAKAIARDGEGARKLITIDVSGAAHDRAATQIALSGAPANARSHR